MNDISTILPNEGTGDLKLGSSKEEVLGYLGDADEATTENSVLSAIAVGVPFLDRRDGTPIPDPNVE